MSECMDPASCPSCSSTAERTKDVMARMNNHVMGADLAHPNQKDQTVFVPFGQLKFGRDGRVIGTPLRDMRWGTRCPVGSVVNKRLERRRAANCRAKESRRRNRR